MRFYQSNYLPSVGYAVTIIEAYPLRDGFLKADCYTVLSSQECPLDVQYFRADFEGQEDDKLELLLQLAAESVRNRLQVEVADPLYKESKHRHWIVVELAESDQSVLGKLMVGDNCRDRLQELAKKVRSQELATRLRLLASIRVETG